MENTRTSGAFLSRIRNPVAFRFFLWKQLPAALFSGVRILSVSENECVTTVPYKWFTRNPFRSTYFACLSMAAEMSTGTLAMAQVYHHQPPVSLIVTGIEGKFHKKATGVTRFTCSEGDLLREGVERSVNLATPQVVRVHSVGVNEAGEMVAEFWVTWSFRARI